MTVILPSYYRATAVPDQLRGKQCQLCRTPIDKVYDFCFQCNSQPFARPDVAGFVTYAVKKGQSGAEMYRYKNHRPSPQALKNVLLLLQHGLLHLPCAGRLMGMPSEAVAVAPSRSHYQTDTLSKLQQLCHHVLLERMPLVSLRPAPGSTSDRQVRGSAFEVVDCQAASHVTIIDAPGSVAEPRYRRLQRCEPLEFRRSPCWRSPAGSTLGTVSRKTFSL